MRTLTGSILLALATSWGCQSGSAARPGQVVSDRTRITREQLELMSPLTALEAVERYHREWLRGRSGTVRSPTGRTYPQVFVDGRPFGTMDTLSQIGTAEVEEIRFIPAADATTRYGTGYPAGIIEVILRKGAQATLENPTPRGVSPSVS